MSELIIIMILVISLAVCLTYIALLCWLVRNLKDKNNLHIQAYQRERQENTERLLDLIRDVKQTLKTKPSNENTTAKDVRREEEEGLNGIHDWEYHEDDIDIMLLKFIKENKQLEIDMVEKMAKLLHNNINKLETDLNRIWKEKSDRLENIIKEEK